MSESSAVPATPGGLVFPAVENCSAADTVSARLTAGPQLPAASLARSHSVYEPSLHPRTSMLADRPRVVVPVPVRVIGVPAPTPGSAPRNHSAWAMALAVSVGVAVSVVNGAPAVGLGVTAAPE